jgi:hypothetical protein
MSRPTLRLLGFAVFAGALAWSAAGCGGPDEDAICKDSEACRTGNDKDVEACKVELEYIGNVASDVGCSDEYDTYFQCMQDHATCKNGNWGDTTNACETETNAWNHCMGGNVKVD